MDWAARSFLNKLLFFGVLGIGGYVGFRYLESGPGTRERDDCERRRAEIVGACEEVCGSRGPSISAVRGTETQVMIDDKACLEKCSEDRFHQPLPICASRRRR